MSSVQLADAIDNSNPAGAADFVPSYRDWEDLRRHLEAEEAAEMCDRAEEMEKIRRADFGAALSAANAVRSIAVTLATNGYESIPVRLLQAASEVEALVHRYGR